MSPSAADIITALDLRPHPEGGHYRETWKADAAVGERAAGTAIYFLLAEGEVSHWHRVDSAEIWHFYRGAPLELSLSAGGRGIERHILGPHFEEGQAPQVIVPRDVWQTAKSLGAWTLVGCTVSPGFEFSRFELAPPDWRPGLTAI